MGMDSSYEYHRISDPDFPVIFHRNVLKRCGQGVLAHWHENLELLWFIQGRGLIVIDEEHIMAAEGDLVVIDSNGLHRINALSEECRYNCLIVDKSFCEGFGFPVGEVGLCRKADNTELGAACRAIAWEMEQKRPHYKAAVQAAILTLLTRLYRDFTVQPEPEQAGGEGHGKSRRFQMVRQAISFLRRAYRQPLTVDEICREAGFSKYYFCRVFHEVTGKTVVEYLNFLRCENARLLLASGCCNVKESAERCGFRNDSYFSRLYKRQIGELPSETLRKSLL